MLLAMLFAVIEVGSIGMARKSALDLAEAKALDSRVVADSVESTEQEKALASLGVEIVQGYLYGPEVAPPELRMLIVGPA